MSMTPEEKETVTVMANALRSLIEECQSNNDFATEHESELTALDDAWSALSNYDILFP